jgi:hypothetical protein
MEGKKYLNRPPQKCVFSFHGRHSTKIHHFFMGLKKKFHVVMKQIHARIIATLLRLKAHYDQFTMRPYRHAAFFVCLVLFGIFFVAEPARAFGLEDIADYVLAFFTWIAALIAALLASLIVVILDAMKPVMLYNEFTNAPVVETGWALVRDTVNMFFVIVLIVIAFGTIFGHKKFQWQTQVPRLLVFAILINFSKTLAGIMIDFGQVIMLTFANALRDILAGNIIELFGLNKVQSFTATSDDFNAFSGITGWQLLLATLAAVFILMWVLGIMLLLFAILLYRIVALWVLIVVAPLAWFAGGAEILGSSAYRDWWEQFKCMVAVGPIITFFLWLALAVAGAGSAAEGFNSSTNSSPSSFFTAIFEFQSFMSLVVGSALLMAGMQTAQKFCSTMGGGFLGKQLGRTAALGPGIARFGKGVGLKLGARGLRKIGGGLRATGRGLGRKVTPWAEQKPIIKYATKRGRAVVWGKIGQKGGKILGRYGQKREAALLGARHEEIAKAGKKYKDDTLGQKASQLNRFANTKTGSGRWFGGELEAKALFKEMLGNKKLEDQFVDSGGDINALWKRFGGTMEEDFRGDADTLDKLNKFKKRYAHQTGAASDLKDADDLKDLSVAAMGDAQVRDQLKQMKVKIKRGKNGPTVEMSGMAAMADGYFGEEKQKRAQGHIGEMDTGSLSQLDAKTLLASVSVGKISEVANLALNNKNIQQVQQIVSGLIDKHDDVKTSSSDRDDIAKAIEGIFGRLGDTITKKEGQPRFLARTEALQSMMKRDFPGLPATQKEAEKKKEQEKEKEEKVKRIQTDISSKEQELASAGGDIEKRIKIQDEINALKAQLPSAGTSEGAQEGQAGAAAPAGDLSAINGKLSTMNATLTAMLDALSNPSLAPENVPNVQSEANKSLDRVSEQIEEMIKQMSNQKEVGGKADIKKGFGELSKALTDLTALMRERERIAKLKAEGKSISPTDESKFNLAALQQLFLQLQNKLIQQQQLIRQETARRPTIS